MILILYHVLSIGDYRERLSNWVQSKRVMDHRTTREAAARMASGAQVFYLHVGTKHHFFELDHILSLLQKDLRGLVVRSSG